jgi:DNA-binding LacI/PurR family transcriptional regulator/signal transduction histidine kinase
MTSASRQDLGGRTIGALCAWLCADTYVTAIASGIERAALARGASFVAFTAEGSPDEIASLAARPNIDGLIVFSATLIPLLRREGVEKLCRERAGLPMVSLNVPIEGVATVTVDGDLGMGQAIEHLIQKHGRKRIAFVQGPPGSPDAQARYRVYRRVLEENGVDVDPALVTPVHPQGFCTEAGVDAARVLFDERKTRPDAIVSANDNMAIGLLDALEARGIRVPSDIAIVGFDDIEEAHIVTPPLTTVRQPLADQGALAAELVMALIRGETIAEKTALSSNLVVRRSCGCFPSEIEHVVSEPAPERMAPARMLARALEEELVEGHRRVFLDTFDEVLSDAMTHDEPPSELHRVLSGARQQALAGLAPDPRLRTGAENLIHQGRLLLSSAAQRTGQRGRLNEQRHARDALSLVHELTRATHLSEIADALGRKLPHLDVRTCLVARFDAPGAAASTPTTRMLVRISDGVAEHYPEGVRYARAELAPREMLPAGRPFTLVVAPIEDHGVELGTLACEIPIHKAALYDMLRLQLGTALSRLDRETELVDTHARFVAGEKMASIGRLTAGIAHEMHTPLAAVRTSLDEIDKLAAEYRVSVADPDVTAEDYTQIAAEMGEALRLAKVAAERLAGFVRGIKVQTRDLAPREYRTFDAVPVLSEALMLLAHAARDGGAEIAFEADGRCLVHGSPGRLAQIITNLVVNAIDAQRGKGGGKVAVRARTEGAVILEIEDHGTGIDPAHMGRIFDPMFTTKPFGQGTGLGLTIVNDIVTHEFGGSIEIDTRPGEGTTFIVRLPTRPTMRPSGGPQS